VTLELPEHLSYSQYSTYSSCPRQYFLSRVRLAPGRQAWYFLIGSAIHDGIEYFIKTGNKANPTWLLNQHVESALKADADMDNWMAGGSKEDPIIKAKALALVEDCLATAYEFISGVEVVEGSVEMDISGRLPGVNRRIKAYVDALVIHPKHGPMIIDWKSSSSKPKDNFQLKVYRSLLMGPDMSGDYREFTKGKFVMLRPGVSDARPVDLSDVTPESVGAEFAKVEAKIDRRIWNAKPAFMCNFCSQKINCSLMSGSNEWDTSEEEGIPF
jgi:hypothetical protein